MFALLRLDLALQAEEIVQYTPSLSA